MKTMVATKEKQISPIYQIKKLVQQPAPGPIRSRANEEIAELEQELAVLERETKAKIEEIASHISSEIARLEENLKELDSPLESAAKKRLEKEISVLAHSKDKSSKELVKKLSEKKDSNGKRIKTINSVSSAKATLLPKYPFIKIEEIPWLSANKRKPLIIPIHESDPTFELRAPCASGAYSSFSSSNITLRNSDSAKLTYIEELEETLKNIFVPHVYTWIKEDHMETERRVRYTFTGGIPRETKEAMKRARPDFPHGALFMLADADTLTVSVESLFDPDPLIVGYHPDTPDLFWLVASFDMTPIEKLINNEALKRFWEENKREKTL